MTKNKSSYVGLSMCRHGPKEPLSRHLAEFAKKAENSMCYFVAPSIFSDSVKQIEYVKQTENLSISPKTIEEFLEHLEDDNVLYGAV